MSNPFHERLSALGQQWKLRVDSAEAERLVLAMAQQKNISPFLAKVLVGRDVGLEEAEAYLHPTLKDSLSDPAHLRDCDKAVTRLMQAIEAGEKIAVFGDYDVDGATSSALLVRYFRELGVELTTYIPDRMGEGYGPNTPAFMELADSGHTLIITVDCGTVAYEPIEAAKERGVDVMVLDHHVAEAQLPDAVAVVNPNRMDQDSDCTHLAAVGVTFLVLVSLNRALRDAGFFAEKKEPNLLQWLDIVALGTVCDVMQLTTINRAFVAQGLKIMRERRNPGIRALFDVAGLDETPNTYHLGFVLGPRINAGGRVGSADLGVRLLSSEDALEVRDFAKELDTHNRERQAIESMVLEQAMAQAEKQHNSPFIMVAGEDWHEGVIGIVAGRVKEQFYRPSAVLVIKDGVAKASARSIAGVDVGAAIISARQEGLLLAGGGHAMAGGFSVEVEKMEALRNFFHTRLEKAVTQHASERSMTLDAVLPVGAITAELMAEIEQGAPYGMGNPAPRIALEHIRVLKTDILKDQHIKLLITDAGRKDAPRFFAMAFRAMGTPLEPLLMKPKPDLLLAGQPKWNHWNGNSSLQFIVDDAI